MRLLVVGLGLIAQLHIRHLKDVDPSLKLAVWRQRSSTPADPSLPVDRYFTTAHDALNWQPDAAVIANPTSMHVEAATMLASQGVHLFVEKPISDRMEGVDRLIETCRQKNLVLMVGYDLRFFRPLRQLRQAIHDGKLGRPISFRAEVGQYLPDWRPGRDYRQSVSARRELGGGVLLELSHEIDYARWLMGEVVSVSATTGKLSDLEVDVEDTAEVTLRFENGETGHLHLDMVDRAHTRYCRVVGTRASRCCNLIGAGSDGLRAEMEQFLACCRGDAEPPVNGNDGRRVLEIVLAAKRSAKEEVVICL